MQTDLLAVPKGMKVKEPKRKPDMYSKRGVPYWFGPEWVRKSGKTCGRILPVRNEGDDRVTLHMLSTEGNLSYIQGSIQEEFQDWLRNTKREVVPWRDDLIGDCILLGVSPTDLQVSDWKYETK
jgi:hypothetical protein